MNKVCERGTKEGGELVVDHIKPKDKGRTNDINNGQTLCRGHNLMKKKIIHKQKQGRNTSSKFIKELLLLMIEK